MLQVKLASPPARRMSRSSLIPATRRRIASGSTPRAILLTALQETYARRNSTLISSIASGSSGSTVDLPTAPSEGNILLADAEARALHSLFLAETSALNEAFAARLKAFLETHFALLAFYEDEMRRFHMAAKKGSLASPFPQDAVHKVGDVIDANTPTGRGR